MPLTGAEAALFTALLGALIGLVLALTGAGGGILSVPLLVFGLQLSVQQAAPVGMAAVFMATSLGAVLGLREGIVRYRAAVFIGAVGMLMAPFGLALAQVVPNRPLLVAFASVLMFSAWRTLKNPTAVCQLAPCVVNAADQRLVWTRPCARALAGTGVVSGLLSGLLGVGGGFVIVPALSRYTDLDLRSVQATSLAVMALVSLSGLCSAAVHGGVVWHVAAPFAGGATMALLLGQQLARRLDKVRLQQGFAWFCVVVGLMMLGRVAGVFPD